MIIMMSRPHVAWRSNEETGHLEALLQKLRQGVKALEEELETPGISRQQQSLVSLGHGHGDDDVFFWWFLVINIHHFERKVNEKMVKIKDGDSLWTVMWSCASWATRWAFDSGTFWRCSPPQSCNNLRTCDPFCSCGSIPLRTHSLRMKRAELQRALRESQRLSDVAAEVPMV